MNISFGQIRTSQNPRGNTDFKLPNFRHLVKFKFCYPQSSEIFGQKFQWIYHLGKFALVKILEETLILSFLTSDTR